VAAVRGWTRADTARTLVLVVAAALFAAPVVAAAVFGFSRPAPGFTFDPLLEGVRRGDFWPMLQRSLLLAVLTTAASFALLIPTLLHLHLRLPRALPLAEALSVLPMVVPAVALVNGTNLSFRLAVPGFVTSLYSLVPFYVLLSMPLVYRALDAGMRAIDLRTLTQAATSLGAGGARALLTVVLPNMRPALLTAAMLTTTIALGEFAVAQLLLHSTFPTFLAQIGLTQPRSAAAFSFLTIVGTWALMGALTRASRARATRTPATEPPTARPTAVGAPAPTLPLPRPVAAGTSERTTS
jgi:putative spermidine/putrescine transport system permease protein